MTSKRTLVIVPTYNERDNLREVVTRTLAAMHDIDVLIVDDASPDGTGALAHEFAAEEPRINVIERQKKRGLGTAYVLGFGWALEREYAAIVEMDADLSHDPERPAAVAGRSSTTRTWRSVLVTSKGGACEQLGRRASRSVRRRQPLRARGSAIACGIRRADSAPSGARRW